MRRARVAVLAVFATMSSSCSLLFVKPARIGASGEKTSRGCTESQVAPVLDTIVWVVEGFRTAYALVAPASAYTGQMLSRPADIAIGTSLVFVFAVSSAHGLSSTAECRQLIADEE